MSKIIFKYIFIQEVRNLSSVLTPILFFSMINVLFPLGLDVHQEKLSTINPMVAWVTLLLSCLLIAERFFTDDYQLWIHEQWFFSKLGLYKLLLARIVSKWVCVLLPMIGIELTLSLLFGVSLNVSLTMMISYLLGSPIVLLVCLLMAAAGLSININSGLLALLSLPILVPIFIFGSNLAFSDSPLFILHTMSALFVLSLLTLPSCICYLLKVSFE